MPLGGKREGAGRKAGGHNKSTPEVRALLDAVFAKVDPVKKLVALLNKPMDPSVEARVLLRLLEYRYGLPQQTVAITGADGGPVEHTISFEKSRESSG